jgi:hypothetical protein
LPSLTPAEQYAIDSVSEKPGISGEKVQKGAAVKIKLRDPLPALVHLAKILGVLPTGATVRAFNGPKGPAAVQVDSVSESGCVVILPDNGRGDGLGRCYLCRKL